MARRGETVKKVAEPSFFMGGRGDAGRKATFLMGGRGDAVKNVTAHSVLTGPNNDALIS